MYSTTAGETDDRSQGEDDSREDVQCYHKYSTAIQVNILTRLQMSIQCIMEQQIPYIW